VSDMKKVEPNKGEEPKPHLWTIVLSVVAIVVSVLSYWESYRSRLLNEELNRPLVRIIAVDAYGPVLGKFETASVKQENDFSLQLRNSGKAFATGVTVTYKAQLDDARDGKGFAKFADEEDASTSSEIIGDLAPEDEYRQTFWALVLKNNPTVPFGEHNVNMVSLVVKGYVSYRNPINNVLYKEDFCFSDPGSSGHFRRCPIANDGSSK
jgi:hypothetical protein